MYFLLLLGTVLVVFVSVWTSIVAISNVNQIRI